MELLNYDHLEETKQKSSICFFITAILYGVLLVISVGLLILLVYREFYVPSDSFDDGREPVIGLTGMRLNDSADDSIRIPYIEALEKAGAVPVGLSVLTNFNAERIRRQVENVDALLIQGGYDVHPSLYGEEPKPELGVTNYTTDIYIIEAIKQATAKKIPILGICRGIQIINVAFGGTLWQDISYAGVPSKKHTQTANGCMWNHTIKVNKGSMLAGIFPDNETMWVNSYHHQALKDIAKGFEIDAKSEDNLVEAFHKTDPDHWIFGVQFHPEKHVVCNNVFLPIFEEFIKQAKLARKNRNMKA
jgi:putative glutamine amidotransferase